MGDMTREIAFTKGHGTENDFVLVPDLDGARELTPETVAALADRRAGIGGDGVIRIVPAASAIEAEVRDQARSARWFMDYRNADGSVAEMCGNGTRVFAGPRDDGFYVNIGSIFDLANLQPEGTAVDIQWNFEKFLVTPGAGEVIRCRPGVEPLSDEVTAAIVANLPA